MVALKLSLAAAALASSASAAATGGDFNVLSMNVAGLPAILNGNEVPGDKATNAGTIGTLFSKYDYDVINMQEGMLPSSRCLQNVVNLTIQISHSTHISMPPTLMHTEHQPLEQLPSAAE